MKRNKILSLATRCVSVTLLFFFLLAAEGYTQQVDFCGEFHKANNPVPTDSIYYMDRFGNYYTEVELAMPPISAASSLVNHRCPALNRFRLAFDASSNFTNDEEETINCAFVELSRFVLPRNPALANVPNIVNVFLLKGDTGDGQGNRPLALDSGIWQNRCSPTHNSAWRKFNTLATPQASNIIDITIIYDETFSQWENFQPGVDIDPQSPNVDLYTVTIHEALHGLGFSSRLPDVITAGAGNANLPFSKWDDLLFNRTNNSFLLERKQNQQCGCTDFGLPVNFNYDALLTGCANQNLMIGCQGTVQVNTLKVGSNRNSISHLCELGGDLSLMSPNVTTGVRKPIRQDVQSVLCELGYQTIFCNPNPEVIDDLGETVIINAGNIGNSPAVFKISYAQIRTANSLPSTARVRILKNTGIYFLTEDASKIGVTLNNIRSCGRIELKYSIEVDAQCARGKTICRQGDIFIFRDCLDIPQCSNNDCNLVCDGNLDNIIEDLYIPSRKNFDILGIPNVDKASSNSLTNVPFSNINVCNTNTSITSPASNGRYLFFVSPQPGQRLPAYLFRLKKPLNINRPYRLNYRRFAACGGTLNFVFSDRPPCQPFETMGFLRGPANALNTDCTGYKFQRITDNFTASPLNPPAWNASVPNQFTVDAGGEGATYLIIFAEPNTTPFPVGIGQGRVLLFDDFELEALDDAHITIAPSVQNFTGCIGGQATINFTVTNTAGLAGDFVLTPRLPAGLTLVSSTNTGTVHINASNPNVPTSITSSIVVNIPAGTNPNAIFNIWLDFASRPAPALNNACLVSSANARLTVQAATPVLATIGMSVINCQNLILDLSASSSTAINATKVWSIREVDVLKQPLSGFMIFSTAGLPSLDFGQIPYLADRWYEIQLKVTLNTGSCTTMDTKSDFIYRPDCSPAPLCNCPTGTPRHNINAANGEILYSNTTLKNNRGLSNCATVTGTLIIDEATTFSGMTFMMQPGARIRVLANAPGRLDINNGCVFKSCLQRWQGIDIEPNTNFNSWNSTYEDAEVALKFNSSNGNSVAGLIQGNTFNKNYIGIDVKGVQNNMSFNIRLFQNTFDCTDNLLPPTTAFTANTGAKGWTGIRSLYGVFNIGQDASATNKNIFKNIRNGVLSLISNISSYNTDINSLVNDVNTDHLNPYIPTNISHTGIAGWGSMFKVYDNTLTGLSKGVHLESGLNFEMKGTTITPDIAGVYNTYSNASFVASNLCKIELNTGGRYGYRMFDCQNSNVNLYSHALFSLLQGTTQTSPHLQGYYFYASAPHSGSTGTKRLLGIKAKLSTDYNGIGFMGDGRYQILNSSLFYFTQTNQTPYGISLINSNNNTLVGNNPSWWLSGTPYNGTAFWVKDATANNFCCNSPQLYNGFDFDGTCTGTNLKNTIFFSNKGLHINLGTSISPQGIGLSTTNTAGISNQNDFNRVSPNPPTMVFAARHESAFNPLDIVNVQSSKFWVRNEGHEYVPTKIEQGTLAGANAWFQPGVAGTHPTICSSVAAECGVSFTPFQSSSGSRSSIPIPESIMNYVVGIPNGLYGNYLQHEGSKWALAELENNPQYLGTNLDVDRFYVNTFNSNIRRFNDIEQLVGQFNAPNPQEESQRDNVVAEMNTIDDEINALDVAFALPNLTESQKTQNMQERGVLIEERALKFQALIDIQDSIKQRTQTLVDAAEEINRYINPIGNYEINEQKMNVIYFRTLARGAREFSELDKATINAMAALCPKIAGKGVYRARYLQSLYLDIYYADIDNCIINNPPTGGGINSKIAKVDESLIQPNDFKVYPNPTNDYLNVEIKNSLTCNIILRDITGRIVYQESASNSAQINVVDFINGIYICEFWQTDKCRAKEKIIIIH